MRPAQSTEVLFIEQCYNYLKENGYLAIVIPDGILTNSSLQYVRDGIEEMYRIVAVISLPQTAFTHTGAGVKSSVLFLRKHPLSMMKKIQKTREDIQVQVRQELDYQNDYKHIIQTRDEHIKKLLGFSGDHSMPKSELLNSEGYIEWKKAVMSQYTEQIEELKEKAAELYYERKMMAFSSPKLDYRIFMAIVEDVGYDATGRQTQNNELKQVVNELARFIDAIEKDEE